MGGFSVTCLAVVGKPVQAGPSQPVPAGLADRFAASGVLIVWGHILQARVQPDCVVVDLHRRQLGTQGSRVGDRQQVRILALEVTVEGLDPGLIGRRPGPAEMLPR